ncbi:MAG: DUF3662 and FHA domain-containing protein [Actinomycetota bacterium]|nr:DUF3662 and FHA domain-containing protein [Actinomycetota bacterium]MDP3630053.1 DUF3662 and FHA domain-containing protein [Actinomycetota bacterium]
MGILSDFEDRIGTSIEGLFAGAFRSPVQPAELAKTLGRAMDDGRVVGVDKVYAPVAYTIAISADDDELFGTFKPTLAGELGTYLTDHAREHGYALPSRPVVAFAVHDDLRLGRFRVSATLAKEDADPGNPSAAVPSRRRPTISPAGIATVTVGEFAHDVALRGEQIVVGRLSDCQVRLADANVSRRHAAFISIDDGWAIEDLDSTNGTRLNGLPVTRARLSDGDVIEIGLTQLVYHEPRG